MDGSNISTHYHVESLVNTIKKATQGKCCYEIRRIVTSLCHNSPLRVVHSGYKIDCTVFVELAIRETGTELPKIKIAATEKDVDW